MSEHETITEYVPAAENTDESIQGDARLVQTKVANSWVCFEGEQLENVEEYRAQCSCGEEFGSWGAAKAHAEGDR